MSKLFCDCKTDEEKSNFFLSGQGVETGIIAPAISNEVAMAFHRCFEFEKQLAAAIAACKLKDEALESWGSMKTTEWLRIAAKALAIQPDDSTLREWLGEPVAWRTFDGEGGYDFRSYDDNEDYRSKWDARNPNHKSWVELLYSPKGLK